MAKFKVNDVVEDIGIGDLPFVVVAVYPKEYPVPSRYKIESIEGESIDNFPEYLLRRARPARESNWGAASGARNEQS